MTSMGCVIPKPVSIVIIGTSAITSDLLMHALMRHSGFVVYGCARSIEDAVRIVNGKRPDIAVINASEENGTFSAIAMLNELVKIKSPVRSIVLSSQLTPENTVSYFRAQARGLVSSVDTDFAVLCKCIGCVSAGQVWANSEQLDHLITSLVPVRERKVVNANGQAILSGREQEVLHLLSEGLSNRELASALKLSEHTIKNHLFHIFDKLGVSTRMEAALYSLSRRDTPEYESKQQPGIPYAVKRMA